MSKVTNSKKLALKKRSVRTLSEDALANAVGGADSDGCNSVGLKIVTSRGATDDGIRQYADIGQRIAIKVGG